MYQQDWLDDLSWSAILAGVLLALGLQVVLTFALLRPLNLSLGWPAVVVVEWCVAAGAFITGWRARQAAVFNGLVTALISAVISLAATVVRTPIAINIWSLLFLFGSFATMGLMGGLIAGQVRARQVAR